jgi:hypothetical protein
LAFRGVSGGGHPEKRNEQYDMGPSFHPSIIKV